MSQKKPLPTQADEEVPVSQAKLITGKYWARVTYIPNFGSVTGIITKEAAEAFCCVHHSDETLQRFVSSKDVHTAWNNNHQRKSRPE